MRRGLMGWNAEELPVATLEARLTRLRAGMAKAGMDAFIIYTNNTRPSAVAYVTGFTPYWSDALMLVPKTGAPVFATALSKRVSEWIRTTDPLSEIVNTPKPGTLMGERLAKDAAVMKVGILEYDTLPSGLADEMAVAAPAVEWTDGTALFTSLRREVDDSERGLLARADAMAVAALREAETGKAKDAGTLAGLIEQSARLAGAEETYIAVAPDLATDRRLRGARFDCLQRLLGSPHAHVCKVYGQGRCVVRRRGALAGGRQADRFAACSKAEGFARSYADQLDGRKLHR
jgi:Xaa-Pro aminopeptidase